LKKTLVRAAKQRFDLPDGQITIFVSSPVCKNKFLLTSPKSSLQASPSRPIEGRIAIVTDAGRDVVDAAAHVRANAIAGRVSRERSQRADERRFRGR
jgi:hypothetical protein